MSEVVLTQYTVFDRPRDFPLGYVVRGFDIVRGNPEPVPHQRPIYYGPSLDAARRRIPEGMVCLGRYPEDDPTILEVWT